MWHEGEADVQFSISDMEENVKNKKWMNKGIRTYHGQLVVSIPSLSAPFCHSLGKINTMRTIFSM